MNKQLLTAKINFARDAMLYVRSQLKDSDYWQFASQIIEDIYDLEDLLREIE